MEYYFSTKRNEIQIHITIWTSLENIMLSEKSLLQKSTYCMIHLYEIPIKGKYIDTESTLVVA